MRHLSEKFELRSSKFEINDLHPLETLVRCRLWPLMRQRQRRQRALEPCAMRLDLRRQRQTLAQMLRRFVDRKAGGSVAISNRMPPGSR
jgi:hypothetical protein